MFFLKNIKVLTPSHLSASFLRENEPFQLENASKLTTHEFLNDIFKKKILLIFFVKNLIQKVHIFLKNKAMRSEKVKSMQYVLKTQNFDRINI